MTARLVMLCAAVAVALAGCYREKREIQPSPPTSPEDPTKVSAVLPGSSAALRPGSQPTPDR